MKNRINQFLLSLVFSFSIFTLGCKEVEIKDGRVPAEYLDLAKQVEGTYLGEFDKKPATIEIVFEGDKPKLTYTDDFGHDILDPACQSHIGDLKSVLLYEQNKTYILKQANFAFQPGVCRTVQGRVVELHFQKQNKIDVVILDHTETRQNCNPNPPPYGGGNCPQQTQYYNIQGQFTKK